MNAERWQQVNNLFERALELPVPNRAAFLDQACAGDDDLRHQVAAMLDADAKPNLLIDQPAHEMAKLFFSQTEAEIGSGQMIGSYRLLREIGRGGMGRVYLAEDTRLGRQVALKLLPEVVTGAPDRIARFQREARAASALNHPNILTIYDFGREGEQHYIASEFVEGQTLRALVGDSTFTLSQTIDVVAQMAAALAAAHRAGIIHRDIKPENAMLRPDGYVKVLDFGLAKLTERNSSASSDEDAKTNITGAEAAFETKSGIVLGTASYMSPEQAKGEKLDERTDIFSLGVVLYELATGHHPFLRNSRVETMVALLQQYPPLIAQCRGDAPAELQSIITRALAKDRADRYAGIDQMQAELKRLKQLLDAAEVSGGISGQVRATTNENIRHATAATEAIVSEPRQPRSGMIPIGLAILVVLAAAVFLAARWLGVEWTKNAPFEKFVAAKLTRTGNVRNGTISPDGKYLAIVEDEPDGKYTLRVRQLISGGNLLPLVSLTTAPRGIAFSPDSNFLYYILPDPAQAGSNVLYRVALLGGEPRKLLTGLNSLRNSSFSPDGRQVIFLSRLPLPSGSALIVANLDGSAQRTFATFTEQQTVWGYAWSPDGRIIVYSLRDEGQSGGNYYYLAAKPVSDGPEQMIVPPQQQWIAFLSWMPDGRGLLANALDETTGRFQLYHFSYPDGAKRQITRDGNNYTSPVLTADGRTVLLGETERPSSVRVAPFNDPTRARQFTPGQGSYNGLVWTRDGKLLLDSLLDLWLMPLDGSAPRQLTADARGNQSPALSPDGRFIVFSTRRTGRYEIWRMEMDGSNPVQLSTKGGERPQCSPDGRWVIYENESEGATNRTQLWKVPLLGGMSEPLFDFPASNAAISPDGKSLACELDNPATKEHGIGIVSLADGKMIRFFNLTRGNGGLTWTPNGQTIIFIDGQSGNRQIKLQPIAGGPSQTLLNSPNEIFFAVALSPDGNQIAYTSGRITTDLVQLTEAK
ncbi:MAG: protein kinase [Acidobacteriota bacterium]